MNPDVVYQLLSTTVALIPIAVFVATLINAAKAESDILDNEF